MITRDGCCDHSEHDDVTRLPHPQIHRLQFVPNDLIKCSSINYFILF